jgi:hypothetical protein
MFDSPKFVWNAEHKRWDAIAVDDSKLAQWAASFSLAGWSRMLRKQPAAPSLRITEQTLQKIAELAGVENGHEFGDHICGLMLDAHKNDARLNGSSAKTVKQKLETVIARAQALKETLRDIDVGGSAEYPGSLLEYQLEKTHFKGQSILLPELSELLDELIASASKAKPRKQQMGRRPAAGGNPAFNGFIECLYMAARQRGGELPVYKDPKSAAYKGNLLSALEILKPYLPVGFYPPGDLGRSVDHIIDKLKVRRPRQSNHKK